MSRKEVKEAKVGCFTYKIRFQKSADDDCGSTDLTIKEIYINTAFDLQIQKETLFHELLHVAFEDCPILDKKYEKDDDKEEDVVRFISPRLVQILQDNPWIPEFIFK